MGSGSRAAPDCCFCPVPKPWEGDWGGRRGSPWRLQTLTGTGRVRRQRKAEEKDEAEEEEAALRAFIPPIESGRLQVLGTAQSVPTSQLWVRPRPLPVAVANGARVTPSGRAADCRKRGIRHRGHWDTLETTRPWGRARSPASHWDPCKISPPFSGSASARDRGEGTDGGEHPSSAGGWQGAQNRDQRNPG